jgi:PAS domain S-box-containing protein
VYFVKIKTKLQLIITVNVLLMVCIFSVSLLWQKQAEKQLARQNLVMELNLAIFDQSRLREEYFLYQEDRSKEQFLLLHKHIGGLLERISRTFTGLEEKASLFKMTGFHNNIESYWGQVVDLDKSTAVHNATVQALRERIVSQMLVNAHSLYREGLNVLQLANEEKMIQNNLAHLFINIFFGVLSLFIVSFALIVIRNIVHPLTMLHKGTEVIALGNLDYKTNIRTRDEIGQLSTAFDVMTEKLHNITVSRDELSKEIELRKQVEAALRKSEEKYRMAFMTSPDSIMITRLSDGMLVSVNKGFTEMSGYAEKDVLGKTSLEINLWKNPADRKNLIEELKAHGEVRNYNACFLTKDKEIYGLISASIIELNAVPHVLNFCRDITELKRTETELLHLNEILELRVSQEVERNLKHEHMLIQQSRMAAMGEMIGNIAHQWRQPLNSLGMLLFNIKDAYQFNTLDAAYLDQAVADGSRMVQKMSTTISDFANFFRPDKEMKIFSMLAQIKEAIALVESSFQNSNISIHIDAPHVLRLLGFPNEYSQVLLNLLTNAKEAILVHNQPYAGRVEIVLTAQDGQGCVSVCDNGGGVPEEILDRIFDPYFSTKERGSGIGLYMSKMIIERNMNGRITAKNIDGGAKFSVCAPLAAES